MKDDLSERVIKHCPIIYRADKSGLNISLIHFGFECSSGWFEMFLILSESIERNARVPKSQGVEQSRLPIVYQVKQKFGGPRFYMRNANKETPQ